MRGKKDNSDQQGWAQRVVNARFLPEEGVDIRCYVVDEGVGLAPPDLPTVTAGLRGCCAADFGCGAKFKAMKGYGG
jgi:hypothetical protein